MKAQSVYPAYQAICIPASARLDGAFQQCRYPAYFRMDCSRAIFTVTVAQAGVYGLLLHYRSGEEDFCQRMDVNGIAYKIGFCASHGQWRSVRYDRSLHAGENEIALYSLGLELDDECGAVDLESLSLLCFSESQPLPLFTLPTITPRENCFYRSVSRDLCYHIQNARPIQGCFVNGQELAFQTNEAAAQDGALHFTDGTALQLRYSELSTLPNGVSCLMVRFEDGTSVQSFLRIADKPPTCAMSITIIDVDHGCSVLFRLPQGQTLLVDTGYEYMSRRYVMPFLTANHIHCLDALIITHYDADHCGAWQELRDRFCPKEFYDCFSLHTYDKLCLGNADFTVLNANGDGPDGDVNANSLSFRLAYHGFVYGHGGDLYAANQNRILREHPEWVRCTVYHGNHHLFGTMSPSYLRFCDPTLFIAQVNAHCYGKGAHHEHFIAETENYLYSHQARLRETLRAFEVGNITLRIFEDGSCSYETFRESDTNRAL